MERGLFYVKVGWMAHPQDGRVGEFVGRGQKLFTTMVYGVGYDVCVLDRGRSQFRYEAVVSEAAASRNGELPFLFCGRGKPTGCS